MPIKLKHGVRTAIDTLGNAVLSPPVGGFGFFRNHGSRSERKIALTFDDGPSRPCSAALLDALAELDAPCTFFCVGVNVTYHADLVRQAHVAGHEIANHSWEHTRAAGLRLGNDCQHIDRAGAAIADAIGVYPRLYRPPWGWMTPWEGRRLTARGYTVVGWDVYTLDWQFAPPTGEYMAAKARRETKPGSIILWHDGVAGVAVWDKQETIRAIRQLVPALRADGYTFVTASSLLGVPAYRPQPTPAR